jgi:hypothetical protein
MLADSVTEQMLHTLLTCSVRTVGGLGQQRAHSAVRRFPFQF